MRKTKKFCVIPVKNEDRGQRAIAYGGRVRHRRPFNASDRFSSLNGAPQQLFPPSPLLSWLEWGDRSPVFLSTRR
ncbi:hypothetical protein FD724_38170 (plasmid) [Nostoc sp. C057]|uniref:hypothetical protein n=1 Tax=Nostoc sp. C057 TaxID=2576903 RepID=UPI0015C36814|nr:hypothetical protein [Nostoc sp. C057]QLE53687.1 hypothetical protein FD724_38170 [Nostoc sp. C057]